MGQEYTVLIVDDEVHAVNGVLAGVDWESLHVKDVYTAHSFAQAKEIFTDHRIDLLLTDIDMPQGSGIDLLTWVRQEDISVEAIFLTCHSDFSYAKEALRLNSLNYLLKPIDYDELTLAIQEALRAIEEKQETKQVKISFDQLKEMQQVHLREQFWLALVNGTIESKKEEIEHLHRKYKMSYDKEHRFLPILIHVENMHGPQEKKERSTYILKSAVMETIAESQLEATVIYISANEILLIIPASLAIDSIEGNCVDFIEKCRTKFELDVCCYIGKAVEIIDMTRIVEHLRVLDRNNVRRENKLFTWEENMDQAIYLPTLPRDRWITFIRAGEKDKLIAEIKDHIQSWSEQSLAVTWESLHHFYQDFLQVIYYSIQRKDLEVGQVFSKELFEKRENVLHSVETLEKWAILVTEVLMDQIEDEEGDLTVVERVKLFVKEHISRHQLSREEIAAYVYFNPDYLARVFKKETGMSISEYIIQERMHKAEEMLQNTNMTISDIALDCGYSNFSYFSTLFKKVNGLTPNEYRKQKQK